MQRFMLCCVFVTLSSLLFFTCSVDNPTAPEISQSDPSPGSFAKKVKTHFTGVDNFVQPIHPGTTTLLPNGKTLIKGRIAEWYESTTDPRVTGQSFWTINELVSPDGTSKLWGTAEIIVDNSGGRWQLSWRGRVTAVGVDATASGIGVEGDVTGLRAKWKYTMIFANGIFYDIQGLIISHE